MDTVRTPKEAEQWFLSHSSGTVICAVDDVKFEICDYPTAVACFEGMARAKAVSIPADGG